MGSFLSSPATDPDLLASPDASDSRSLRKSEGYNGAQTCVVAGYMSSDLKWADHVDAIVSNSASRVHFLKQLKRAGVPIKDLLHIYTAIVRPVL